MIVTLDRSAPELLRDQLAALIREKISSGEWPSRKPIPSMTSLAAEFGVSVVTVQAALRVLKDEGLLFAVTGKGTFVR
jgi:GntR family transcriptional regulator